MEFKCELVKDILPLYVEGLCCGYTKNVVAEHISKCDDCSQTHKVLMQQDKPNDLIMEGRKKTNPFRKVKKRNILITASYVFIAVIFVAAICTKVFSIGFTASTSNISVQNIEILYDEYTFEIELSTNSGLNAIRGVTISQFTDSATEDRLGHVYIRVNTVMVLPFSGNAAYKTSIGYDYGALKHDGITAIYLIGKNQNDVRLIWERR